MVEQICHPFARSFRIVRDSITAAYAYINAWRRLINYKGSPLGKGVEAADETCGLNKSSPIVVFAVALMAVA